jgi:hypothetical protein
LDQVDKVKRHPMQQWLTTSGDSKILLVGSRPAGDPGAPTDFSSVVIGSHQIFSEPVTPAALLPRRRESYAAVEKMC